MACGSNGGEHARAAGEASGLGENDGDHCTDNNSKSSRRERGDLTGIPFTKDCQRTACIFRGQTSSTECGPASDRNIRVLTNLQRLFEHGRLGKTGYLSILPVDQGIEHSAGASFAKNPDYFDSENIVKLAIEGGCNAVASTYGVLGSVARRYAHKIPFIVKMNHNELLTYPNKFDQVLFGSVKEAYDMGAAAVGATIYFGSEQSDRQIVEISRAFAHAHELGMATVLWCYLRNSAFKKDKDYHVSADLTGQANHLGVTIEADIIKQKLADEQRRLSSPQHGRFELRQVR